MKLQYKKMLAAMQGRRAKKNRGRESWFLYILECSDQSLYTGITKDLDRRLKQHLAGKGARYTRTRLPVELKYSETCGSRTEALVRECAVKAYSKSKKRALFESVQ